jgi:hypothetical protein
MQNGVQRFATVLLTLCALALAVYVTMSIIESQDSLRASYEGKLRRLPRSSAACSLQGGNWTRGPFGEEICQWSTTDSGKKCHSSPECEGACLGVDSGGSAQVQGECSAQVVVYGCIVELEAHGAVRICRD